MQKPRNRARRGRPGKKPKEPTRGEKAIAWIEDNCCVPEGRDVGKPVKLREWQRREIMKIYDNPAGTRTAILSFGRKNGKTALAAFLLLLHLCGIEALYNSQLYSTALSREQAAALWDLAVKIIKLSPNLVNFVEPKDSSKEIHCKRLGTKYKALSAEAKNVHGLSPVFIVHDELGRVTGPRSALYEAMETATAAQENPLSLIISTQAPTDADLLSILIDDAAGGHDPKTTLGLYTADPDLDPFAEDTIRLANPALGDFQNIKEVMGMAARAKRMPTSEAEFRNLVLNQRCEATSPFISRTTWNECAAKPKPIEGVPVYGGLDLSANQDLTAFVLLGEVDGVWQVHPTFWLPADGLAEKSQRDRVPYDLWAKQGYLIASPGRSQNYAYVAAQLRKACDQYQVQKIAFDRWNFSQLKQFLAVHFSDKEIETLFVEFGQGYQSMSPAVKRLQREISDTKIAHGDHKVLTMCAHNAVAEIDAAENMKLTKERSAGRIDGMVALAMAFGVVPIVAEREPEYKVFIV